MAAMRQHKATYSNINLDKRITQAVWFAAQLNSHLAEHFVLSEFGKQIRLSRILGDEEYRPLIMAFEHALPLGPIPGTANPAAQVEALAEAGVDGALMNPGIICHCFKAFFQSQSPSLVIRTDCSGPWTSSGLNEKLSSQNVSTLKQALRHGADAVLTYLLIGTGDVEFVANESACTAEFARECEQIGLALIVESLARGKNSKNPASHDALMLHTHIAAELGAYVIKTEYTGDPRTMAQAIDVCRLRILGLNTGLRVLSIRTSGGLKELSGSPYPVGTGPAGVILGGSRKTFEDEALLILPGFLSAGIKCVLIGRNIFQSPDSGEFVRQAARTAYSRATGHCVRNRQAVN
jgi:DhnA family fructose-bisphosphate aldolase class Ia